MINKLSLLFTLFIAIPMFSQSQEISRNLIPRVKELETTFNSIQKERIAELNQLALETKKLYSKNNTASLTFVCTHNSRRSQLAQVWFALAAEWYRLDSLYSYSGGTEATAFNHRMVDALKRFGFDIQQTTEGDNPVYQFKPNVSQPQMLTLFSKKYADDFNPQKGFIAVMVCGEADESCMSLIQICRCRRS